MRNRGYAFPVGGHSEGDPGSAATCLAGQACTWFSRRQREQFDCSWEIEKREQGSSFTWRRPFNKFGLTLVSACRRSGEHDVSCDCPLFDYSLVLTYGTTGLLPSNTHAHTISDPSLGLPRPLNMDPDPREPSSCILFENSEKNVVCLDIPRSIEECQVLSGGIPTRRIYSIPPVETQFPTPEPKEAEHLQGSSTPAARLSELMTQALVQNALQELTAHHSGPFCLPRISKPDPSDEAAPVDTRYSIPEQSEYLCGSIQDQRDSFIARSPVFDLIVLDPPWPNRSARRKKKGYSTLASLWETRELLSLIPIPAHLAQGGLVAIWVTNKHSITELLTTANGLFAAWGLELAAEWVWLKVTATGEPVVDLESTWRKPWERLLVARRPSLQKARHVLDKVIIGVPDVHSRKPNLRSLFDPLLGQGYKGLEIFARNLTAGWWSWGDEVLFYQRHDQWVPSFTLTTPISKRSQDHDQKYCGDKSHG